MFIYSIVNTARTLRADCRQRGGQVRGDVGGEVVGQHFGDVVADFLRVAAVVGQPLRLIRPTKPVLVGLISEAPSGFA